MSRLAAAVAMVMRMVLDLRVRPNDEEEGGREEGGSKRREAERKSKVAGRGARRSRRRGWRAQG